MKLLLLASLIVFLPCAEACSPPFSGGVGFDPTTAYEGELAPTMPVARVVGIHPGRAASRGESTCVETSSVKVAVRDDSPRLPYYFQFREIGGTAPDLILQQGLRAGGRNGDGELQFTFYWPEPSPRRGSVDLEVEITLYTRSGLRGPSATISVSESGIQLPWKRMPVAPMRSIAVSGDAARRWHRSRLLRSRPGRA